ncbi:MAG: aldolase/citrate lyase family protein [Proteobacteria bacterium]|nr:aldolase/citrate lyase family protein [Pseudomonadota bacterium]
MSHPSITEVNSAFAARVRAGETLLGAIIALPCPEVAELFSRAGFDWLFIDTEHSPMDPLAAQVLLQSARCPCMVRVPVGEEAVIKKALDIGAAGVIVPQVNTAADAERIVAYCKYPPLGSRGVGIVRAHGYGLDFQEYVASANDNVIVMLQIENIAAVDNIDAIVRVPGVDALMIGPYDLSGTMGRLGQVNHPEVEQAMETVRKACAAVGMKLGIFAATAEGMKPYIQKGYTMPIAGMDLMLLSAAARGMVQALK